MVGLIGSSVGTSLSPPLHEREADELGLRYLYQLIDIDELGLTADAVGDLVAQAERMGFAGLNITHPCKQTVVGVLDELSPEAEALQAVNTVVLRAGRRIGHNTDHLGFAEGFVRGLPAASLNDVVLVGAGGAGAAVAYALLGLGVHRLTVVDVLSHRAESLAAGLQGRNPGRIRSAHTDEFARLLTGADGLVNASAVGMTPHFGTPVAPHLLRPDMWVADVVYRPLETELLSAARELGCRTLNGGGMVVFQAAAAFALFTGITPDADRMYRHFEELAAEAAPTPAPAAAAATPPADPGRR
jgi:shikimate dehydrogenase